MYLNFRWLMARLPARSKVIVWAATTHVAKDLSGVSGDEGMVSFGSYVRREFGDRAFALVFSAYSGSYAMTGQPVRQLSAAPDDSLDGRAIADGESYVSLSELREECRRVKDAAVTDEEERYRRIHRGRYLRSWTGRDGAVRVDVGEDGVELLRRVGRHGDPGDAGVVLLLAELE